MKQSGPAARPERRTATSAAPTRKGKHMNLKGMPLEQLGANAYGHYKAGQKAEGKAAEQYTSSGLYLKEAKEQLNTRRNPSAPMNFAEFLLNHCPIGKSRAYDIIAIADGRKSPVEEAKRHRSYREEREEPRNSARAETQSETASPQPQPKPRAPCVVKEAEDINAKYLGVHLRVILLHLNSATEDQLKQIRNILNV